MRFAGNRYIVITELSQRRIHRQISAPGAAPVGPCACKGYRSQRTCLNELPARNLSSHQSSAHGMPARLGDEALSIMHRFPLNCHAKVCGRYAWLVKSLTIQVAEIK